MVHRSKLALAASLALLAGCSVRSPLPAVVTGVDALAAQSLQEVAELVDPMALAAPLVKPRDGFRPAGPTRPPGAVTQGNAATLFVSPAETLPALLNEIDGAQHSIYIETFNFGTTYAQRLAPKLIAKAQAGVEVRLLIDYVGSRFLKGYGPLLDSLRKGGVDVEVYKPYIFTDANGHKSFNIIHRKAYFFDGTRALVGGVNLASPFDTTTQDILIRWQGPILGELFEEFTHDWQHASDKPLPLVPVTTPVGNADAQVLVTSPDQGREEIREALNTHIDAAQRSIDIEQQYLWDDAFVAHLAGAAKRGVKVRVLVPGKEQKRIQRTCNYLALNQLVKDGVEARQYHGPVDTAHLHTKFFNIDNAWAITGSCNADTRSLSDNQELDIATSDAATIQALDERLFERDWNANSTVYAPTQPSWFVRPFTSLLDILDYYL